MKPWHISGCILLAILLLIGTGIQWKFHTAQDETIKELRIHQAFVISRMQGITMIRP
jgi:hypothetical protein